MKKITLILLSNILLSSISFGQTFTLKSNDIGGQITNEQVFNRFGCTGKNISPQLSWKNAPKGTKSFAVTMYDPNAPTGSGLWHWVIFDIPSNINEIKQGAGNVESNLIPKGTIQSNTDLGNPGYVGPCPTEGHGIHQYTITVYALKIEKLGLDANANPALVGFYIHSNTLQKASIVSYYKR